MTPHGGLWAVVPAFNEAGTIGAVVAGLRRTCPVIVVDDASTDGSGRVARAAGATAVLTHARRAGKGAALRTGFAAALARGAAAVVTLDGDGQHDPADVPRLADAARRAPDAVVLGDRFAAGGDPMPRLRRLAIRAADRALRPLVPERLSDSQCGFRLYPAGFLRAVALREEGFVLETEALVRAVQAGYRLVSVPVRRVYTGGRPSRFRAVADTALIGWYLARTRLRAAPPGPAPARAPAARGL
jgi:glycosyltransferase involved in cell wall biosynthesis